MGVILETIDYEDLDFIDKDAYNNDSYEREICNSLLLESDVPNQDFLIDTIDETSLKV